MVLKLSLTSKYGTKIYGILSQKNVVPIFHKKEAVSNPYQIVVFILLSIKIVRHFGYSYNILVCKHFTAPSWKMNENIYRNVICRCD